MSDFEAPQSRNEAILQNMLGATNTLQPPQSRIEALLTQLLNSGGGGGGALIVEVVPGEGAGEILMDKTAQEIYDAMTSGTPVYCKYADGTPTTSYESTTRLDPVVDIYGYNYDASVRVVVLKSTRGTYMYPCVAVFEAEGMADRPFFIDAYAVKNDSVERVSF